MEELNDIGDGLLLMLKQVDASLLDMVHIAKKYPNTDTLAKLWEGISAARVTTRMVRGAMVAWKVE